MLERAAARNVTDELDEPVRRSGLGHVCLEASRS
jgi:hypothetical protein